MTWQIHASKRQQQGFAQQCFGRTLQLVSMGTVVVISHSHGLSLAGTDATSMNENSGESSKRKELKGVKTLVGAAR